MQLFMKVENLSLSIQNRKLGIKMNPIDFENSEPNYWLSCIIVDYDAMCKQVRGEQDSC